MQQEPRPQPATTSFPTCFSFQFIKRALPRHCRRVLEVGCGTGELAARLTSDGLAVIAIDCDEDCVTAAHQLGVDARVAEWPDFDDGEFDAVLFTRSLHHIEPLAQAVQKAIACLREGGCIIVEDFAQEAVDEKSLRWFAHEARILRVSRLLVDYDELLDDILLDGAALAIWRKHHDEKMHAAHAMETTLQTTVGNVVTEKTAYYFRYFGRAMVRGERSDMVTEALAAQESSLIADGAVTALGRRFVAKI
jgi:SAM-dependent methyltransferase